MFLFLKLFLAHLIADFILQFEELYRLKVRSLWGHIFHVLIHWGVSLVLVWPYLDLPGIWIFVTAATLVHLTQDFIKYTLTRKIPKNTFLYFMADQCVHVLVLGAILFFPVSREVRGFAGHSLWDTLYRDSAFTLFLIFFILLTFAGSYTIHAFFRSYVKNTPPLYGITSFEMAYTLLERSIVGIVIVTAAHPLWILLTPLIGLFRLPFPNMRDRAAFLASFIYACLLSLCFRGLF
ncbi:MAG: DUF3307 domain-containing protein [Candidatus Omnitrophica bacterium]|nr:DUF3307 domain-containing protein [Candidatus Omnitrophota bacterium]